MEKTTAKKLNTKKMFAVMQMIVNYRDPESYGTIIGVYASESKANSEVQKARMEYVRYNQYLTEKDLDEDIMNDGARTYEWIIVPVNIEE